MEAWFIEHLAYFIVLGIGLGHFGMRELFFKLMETGNEEGKKVKRQWVTVIDDENKDIIKEFYGLFGFFDMVSLVLIVMGLIGILTPFAIV